ncbi:hypothetical protein PoB_006524200 [Plakobranchus ocellatus]|uniref:Uncharacterized protein n=1 Tax=Plakobranchus ocellatus TaxID=259542 RepID=A0AAV4D3J6_9GAST|nr:hypothetical protein PoB_006524200 [Plakobranchus ocellatus]
MKSEQASDPKIFDNSDIIVMPINILCDFGKFETKPVHNKVISGFQALCQARAPVAGLEPAKEGSLQISRDSLATVPPTPPQ